MESSRLPGKVLKRISGIPLLEYQIRRLQRCKNIEGIVVATSTSNKENPIIELCEKLDIPVYSGSETDVLSRYRKAADAEAADIIIRITGDCPLIDPNIVDACIEGLQEDCDYISTNSTFPLGMGCEVFTKHALDVCVHNVDDDYDREHVTSYIWRNKDKFITCSLGSDIDMSNERWTVDTMEDFMLVESVIHHFGTENLEVSIRDIALFLDANPSLRELNAMIVQTPLKA